MSKAGVQIVQTVEQWIMGWAEESEFDSWKVQEIFLSSIGFTLALKPTQHPQWALS
jgi:hypothetical protein